MKTKLYLDTSIPSAYFDYNKPVRQLITQKWFENNAQEFSLFISAITVEEINAYQNIAKREKIKQLLVDYKVEFLDFTDEAKKLGKLYMQKGAIPKSEPEDAYHISVATVNNITALASWNFKHIVSINPIRKIHELNKKNNYNLIVIGSLELYGGSEYGNI